MKTSSFLDTSYFPTDATTVFVVNNPSNTTQNSTIYGTSDGPGGLGEKRFLAHLPYSNNYYFDIGTCCGTDARINGAFTGGPSIWSFRANATNGKQVFRNNSFLKTVAGVGTFANHNLYKFSFGSNYSGDFAEFIMFSERLNSTQVTLINNYLSQKYTIAITDDFFAVGAHYNAAYIGDIMGIGTTNGTDKVSASGSSSAFSVKERNNTLDGTNEFVIFAHNPVIGHTNGILTDLGTGITSRWAKDYYVEASQNSVVDGGATEVEMAFDFGDAGLGPIGAASEYVLLYRETTSGNYERVVANDYFIANGDQMVISLASNRFKTGYYTLGKGTQVTTDTWYVFQDGNWIDPGTWTLDASTAPLFNNPSDETPGPEDQVIIRSGRSVTIQAATNNIAINSIEVKGNLYLTTSSGHNFTTINGNGQISLQGNGGNENFPAGVTTGNIGFGDPDNGGTLVIGGTGDLTLPTNRTFKNVLINRALNTDKVILASSYVLNGNFTIRKGEFQFGNSSTSRSLIVEKETLVEASGSISTNNANTKHTFELKGDFTNNGSVKFTNRADFASTADRYNPGNTYYQSDDTNGTVETSFTSGTQDQVVDCNNTTFFSRIVIDKGVDQTYTLFLQATDSANFRLLGRADDDDADGDNASPADNSVAFALIKGTVKLDNNIIIPVLSAGTNYAIPTAARLWIDGGFVRKTVGTAIVPYGVVEISAGKLIADVSSGITSRLVGKLKVDGGYVRANQFRTSVQGVSAQGTYEQNGGTVLITSASINNDYAAFSLTYSGTVFKMTGGTLTVQGRNNLGPGVDVTRGTVFINADPANQNVTGGTIIFNSNTSTEYRITSRAPFYNVIMRAGISGAGDIVLTGTTSGTGGGTETLAAQKLVVINDLIINGYNDDIKNNPLGNHPVTFEPVTSATNVNDVYVGGSFFVGRYSTYKPVFGGTGDYDNIASQPTHRNITYFNQTSATSTIDTLYSGQNAIGSNRLEMGNFVLERNASNQLRTISRSNPNGSIEFDINGNASVLSGILDQNAYTFRIWGSITNYGRMGTYYSSGTYPVSGGTPSLAQIRFREDPPLSITTTDDAIFGNIRFNVGAATQVEFNSDVYIERMEYWNGRIYLKNHTLTVDEIWNINNGGGNYFNNNVATSSYININNTGIVANILVFTDGKASDGGLKLKIKGNTTAEDESSRINNISPITFPVGFTTDGGVLNSNIYSRPAQLKIKDYADDGYIQINVVSEVMQTSNLTGGEILEHYWRFRHEGFNTVPKIAARLYYHNADNGNKADLPSGSTQQANYVPGYVLDGGAYTRYYESNPAEDKTDITTSTFDPDVKCIIFNGASTGGSFDNPGFAGFPLINANFTTGQSTRFVGAPQVFYSRRNGNDMAWDNGNNWSLVGYDGNTAGDYPQLGDVAKIHGSAVAGSNGRHWYNLTNYSVNVAVIQFDDVSVLSPQPWGPRISVNENRSVTANEIKGVGEFYLRLNNTDQAQVFGDIGDFSAQSNSTFNYVHSGNNNSTIIIPSNIPIYPNLDFESENGTGRKLRIAHNATVNYDLSIGQEAILVVDNNLKVNRNIRPRDNTDGFIEFGQGGSWVFEVLNTVNIGNGSTPDFGILVQNSSPTTLSHKFIVHGNIIQYNNGSIDLYNGIGTANNAVLELKGNNVSAYTYNAGAIPDLYKIVMNKGNSLTSTFTFNSEFTLPDITVTNQQPIEILNGNLILNNAALNIPLANAATGNFYLPNTNNPLSSSGSGGLEIIAGKVSISGNNTGMILDGKLAITGGEVDMATATGNGNNFIEYSASGKAEIVLSSGALKVGSQVRRSTTSTSGILKYTQTGGIAQFGVRAAPTSARGVFEIENDGSFFNLDIDPLAGEEFTIVRHNNSTTVPTLLLSPQTHAITNGSVITLGLTGTTPATQNRLGVYADIPLKNLNVRSTNVTAKIYAVPLTVEVLDIGTGTFDANGFNLTINNSLVNNGTFTASGNTLNNQLTSFPSAGASTISGGGTTNFWDFSKSGAGTLTQSQNITVLNNAALLGGTLNTTTYAFNIKKDMVHDAIHTSDVAGPGIIFNGTQKQNLDRTGVGLSQFGTVELNNAAGLVIGNSGEDFQVNNKLVLNTGVMDIGGNLLIFPVGANITNKAGASGVSDFNVNRMIQTNSSIRDFGVRKFFPAYSGTGIDFTYPVGLTSYTPVTINITNSSEGYITVRPVADIPPINLDDIEGINGCTDPELVDSENVLQYYWIVKSNAISGLNGSMKMYYNPADLLVSSTDYTVANYGPARLFNQSNTWDKVFTTADFDEANSWMNFPFTTNNEATLEGIYTAGVTLKDNGTDLLCGSAIPDQVQQFITKEEANTGNVYVDASYQGIGVAPNPGNSFDLVIKTGYTLVYNANSVRTRKITIEPGATLEIASGTNNHNLGFVTGEGNLKLTSNTTSLSFPTGDYDTFLPGVDCSGGGGLEYAGTGTYAVLSDLAAIRNVKFSGSGTRTVPNNHKLRVCEDLEILDDVELIVPDGTNETTVLGNIYKSDGSTFDSGGGDSEIIMAGTARQYISGNFYGTEGFNSLTVNNASGLSVINAADITRDIAANADVDVEGVLAFVNGKIFTNAGNSLRLRQSGSITGYTATANTATRYVDGPFVRELTNNTVPNDFPIGKGGRYGFMRVIDPNGGASPKNWTAEYFNAYPVSHPIVTNTTPADVSIDAISGNEYWVVNDGLVGSDGQKATIGLSWDSSSDVSPIPGERQDLTVMVWNNTNQNWDSKGGASFFDAGQAFGTLQSFGELTFSENIVTLGSVTPSNPLPVELIAFTGKEQDDMVLLSWKTASEQNNDFFLVEHSVDGRVFTEIGKVFGAGTTTVLQLYGFEHARPSYPDNYYRLKQVDYDGAYEYSNVILVRMKKVLSNASMDFVMYPNPTTDAQVSLEISELDFSKSLVLEVISLSGNKLISEEYPAGNFDQRINLNLGYGAKQGVYIVRLSQGEQVVVKKLVLK